MTPSKPVNTLFFFNARWTNSVDDKPTISFLIYPRKQLLTFDANCLLGQFASNVKGCFHETPKPNVWQKYFKMSPAVIVSQRAKRLVKLVSDQIPATEENLRAVRNHTSCSTF